MTVECINAFYAIFKVPAMIDIRITLEHSRRMRRLSQAEMAALLEVSQGHYSKVISGAVPLSKKFADRVRLQLDSEEQPPRDVAIAHRMQALSASIRKNCIELMHLAASGAPKDEPYPNIDRE